MSARVRRKRASVIDLYKSCKAGGDCIPDVKNKVEADTWADKLLKWFGSLVYFGNLGIGTGKGTGGTFGYRPIEPGVGGRTPATAVRPAVPTDIIPETVPGLVLPEGPSIVPLSELTVDTGVVIDTTTVSPDIPTDINILFESTNPTFDITLGTGQPAIISSTNDTAAILEVGTSPVVSTRIILDTFTGSLDTILPNEVSNIFIDPQATGTSIGDYEEIELIPLHREEFEIEEPKTSTPGSLLNRAFNNFRQFYGRSVQQVPVRNPAFLSQPSSLVQFEYENPAFSDAELTLRFQQDVAEIAAAPDEAFSDLHVLHRQYLSETPQGTVRASRVGTKGYMRTRAGTLLGQDVHYYYDFSAIETADSMELATIVDFSGNQAVTPQETSFVYPDNELLDDILSDFNDSQLVLHTEDDEGESISIPTFAKGSAKVFITDIGSGPRPVPTLVINLGSETAKIIEPGFANLFSSDYDIHPAYLKRRKRKLSYTF